MGGAIDCASEPGRGSTFGLTLAFPRAEVPLETPEAAQPAAQVGTEIQAEGAPMRVLLADDHPTNRKVVALILEHAGVELTIAEDGAQALEAFTAGAFDVVLMDMQMPVMDGLSATRAIRDLEAARGANPTPVIMLTANALPEHEAAARAAGADRHLTKPIGAQTLLSALAEVFEAEADRKAA
jgi:CheY-like chemotaxis protein